MNNLKQKIGIIGYTGLIGKILFKDLNYERKFLLYKYNSKNIEKINNKNFDKIYCAGLPAEKWKANKFPLKDKQNIEKLSKILKSTNCKKFILISTIDVYKKKEIYGLGGIIWFEKNVNECLIIKKEIEVDLNLIFKNSKIEKHGERKLPYDTTGKSKQLSQTQYTINNGLVAIECTDFSDNMTSQMGYTDNLKIATYSKEYENFVRNEAY